MSNIKCKAEIINRLQAERRRLERNLALLSPQDMLQPGVVGEWSVKDVLAHLADWQARMSGWIAASRRGENVATPAPDLTWKQVDLLNQRIYEAHRSRTLEEVVDFFRATHVQFMEMVDSMTEEEIMTPGRHAFIGGPAVYKWLSGYAAHDKWGKTKIRSWLKAQNRIKTRQTGRA